MNLRDEFEIGDARPGHSKDESVQDAANDSADDSAGFAPIPAHDDALRDGALPTPAAGPITSDTILPRAAATPNDTPNDLSPVTDKARIRSIFETHFDFVWRALRRLGLRPAEADDGAQQVFLVAARRLKDIAAEGEKAFLFQTARRVASDARRSQQRKREDLGVDMQRPDSAESPADRAEQNQQRVLLDQILADLPLELRSVLILFELEEMTVPEMAQLLALPEGTVSSRLRRARAAFSLAVKRMHNTHTRPTEQDAGGVHAPGILR